MATNYSSDKQGIEAREHDDVFSVKKVSPFVDNGDGTLVRQPKIATEETQLLVKAAVENISVGGGIPANKATDAYTDQAFSEDSTYSYLFNEDGAGNWYVERINKSTLVHDFFKGTGGYSSVYVNSTSGPSGSLSWGSYGEIFNNVGAGSLSFDVNGNLETVLPSSQVPVNSGARKIIDFSHAKIHDGLFYYYYDIVALANGASQDYIFTTPNSDIVAHFGYEIDFSDGAGSWQIFQDTDRNGTTLQTILNKDGNSLNTTTFTLHKGQSGGTSDGTRICWKRAGAGKSLGGMVGTAEEYKFKKNTKFLLRVTNLTTSTNNVTFKINYYEGQ